MKIVNVILKVILSIVLILGVVAFALFISLRSTVLNEEYFHESILDSEYEDIIYERVLVDMEEKSMLFPLGSEPFEKSVSRDEIVKYANSYMQSVFDHIAKGSMISAGDFDSPELYSTIERDLLAYAEQEGLEMEPDSVDVYYTHMCDVAEASIQIVSEGWMNKLPSLAFMQKISFIGYLLPIVCLAAIALILLLDKKEIEKGLYLSMSVAWSGAALVFIPLIMLKIYDLPKRIPLDMPALNVIIKNSMNSFLSRSVLIAGIMLVLFTLLLAAAIVMSVRRAAAEDKIRRIREASRRLSKAEPDEKKNTEMEKASEE